MGNTGLYLRDFGNLPNGKSHELVKALLRARIKSSQKSHSDQLCLDPAALHQPTTAGQTANAIAHYSKSVQLSRQTTL